MNKSNDSDKLLWRNIRDKGRAGMETVLLAGSLLKVLEKGVPRKVTVKEAELMNTMSQWHFASSTPDKSGFLE